LNISDESLPPEKPGIPDGNSSSGVNVEYTYAASTADPDEDQIYYPFDLDDGDFSGWIAAYNTGETAETNHIWIFWKNHSYLFLLLQQLLGL